ncbi:5'/3'-nucleotidase SurE [Azospirillum griseum]|uniref:5'-nucleotidase SurE n=1 Tax=Azospirillum griseum TaxID=2496639 RepID=A0A3S0R9Y9_9PROT|nr:5'/3'-nucleotidase SurE [Azospirillum griseum]RTR21550.1 5'/3'-nucleotidase SurE [Azospirillum griseum]
MFDAPLDLTNARILVTNDDGIHAQGLKVLEGIARSLTEDVWVVAPEMEQSAASHSLTINRPLRLRKLDERRFTVDGTPTDCVLLAINHVMKDARPTLVLSGVNQGSNIGEDVTYSGTIAAAMEGTLLGVPSIALSQHYEPGHPIDWSAAIAHGADVVRKALTIAWPKNVLLNVNFPACPADAVTGVKVVRHGKRKIGDELVERVDPRGKPYIWIGTLRGEADVTEDTDIHTVFHGGISITPIDLDLTHTPTLHTLKQAFV